MDASKSIFVLWSKMKFFLEGRVGDEQDDHVELLQ